MKRVPSWTTSTDSVNAMGGLFRRAAGYLAADAGVVEVNRLKFPLQPMIERVCRDHAAAARPRAFS
ncbi:MAG: hypothetical protein WDM77_21910 [Steroidobacteraceae bacterium]